MSDNLASDPPRALVLALTVMVLSTPLAGCLAGGGADIKQTGSSTVLPLAQAWAQEHLDASVSVSGGGSSHGRNAILTGDAEIGDASSPITASDYGKVGCAVDASEVEAASQGPLPRHYPACNGVTPTEWVVAWDALTVVVHNDNDWAQGLNYSQLASIFGKRDTAVHWDEVPGLEDAPHEEIEIHAPDAASGTYEFFFEEVVGGTEHSLLAGDSKRYHGNANDHAILQKVSSNRHAIGFFGFYYYAENQDRLRAVPVAEEGHEHVEVGFDTAADYPITRPLYLYTDGIPGNETQRSDALRGYLQFIFSDIGQAIVEDVGYISQASFDPEGYEAQRSVLEQPANRTANRTGGSGG